MLSCRFASVCRSVDKSQNFSYAEPLLRTINAVRGFFKVPGSENLLNFHTNSVQKFLNDFLK